MGNLFLQSGPEGKKAIMINMDETPIQQSYAAQRGTIGVGRKRSMEPGLAIERLAPTDKRGIITHVAFVAEDAEIQATLPQVFIASTKLVPQYVADAVSTQLPPNTFLWRGSSSWMNEGYMCRILKLLHASLEGKLQNAYVVLALDMAAPHVVQPVLETAKELEIVLLFIPAKWTWLLQPLDAYVFQSYKTNLRSAYVKARCESKNFGILTKAQWLRSVFEACQRTFQGKDFSKAFAMTGLSGRQAYMSTRIKAFVKALEHMPYEPTVPPFLELQFMAGRGIDIEWALIFTTFRSLLISSASTAPVASPAEAQPSGSASTPTVTPDHSGVEARWLPNPPTRLRRKTSAESLNPLHQAHPTWASPTSAASSRTKPPMP